MPGERAQLTVGMNVMDADGDSMGQIKAVREDVVVVEREEGSDLYVPYNAIISIGNHVIELNVSAAEAARQWKQAPRGEEAA